MWLEYISLVANNRIIETINFMKKTSLISLVVLVMLSCFTACKKSGNNDVVSSNKIVLSTLQVSGTQVTLKWSKLNEDSLTAYIIERVTDTVNTTSASVTSIAVDKNTTQYIDTLPVAPYVQYYVVAQRSTVSYTTPIISNKQTYARTDITFMAISPEDVLYDRTNRMLFLYSSAGDIIRYDLQNKVVSKQIAAQANIGYCDIATYNGAEELYVPRSDGWLFIYDATTLAQIDQINIGTSLYSVACNNGILYVSGTSSIGSSSSMIFAYNRATKSLVSSTNTEDNVRLKLIPGSSSEFLGVSYYSDPYYVKFDNTGHFVSQQMGYLSSYDLNPVAFEIFPDGSKFISSGAGIIVSKTLVYVSSLPHGSLSFSSFDFDNTNQLIYAGCTTNEIQAYSMGTYQLSKTINTTGIPTKMFYDNGTVISVSTNGSSSYYYTTGAYTFVEQF